MEGTDNNELEESGVRYKVNDGMQYENARRMRKEYTEAEGVLWAYLRNGQLGEKFRRQHPVDGYVVDFMCLRKRLIVEVDGGYHDTIDHKLLDEERTNILNNIGFTVIRFTNSELLYDINTVIKKIKDHLSLH